jgi:hypothetical protein
MIICQSGFRQVHLPIGDNRAMTPDREPWECSGRFVGYSETIPSTDDPNLRLSFRKTGISVNSTKALPCIDFFECACGHLGRSVDPVASLLVKSGFCRIRFWYAVAPGSGISRETSRNYFWNLTTQFGSRKTVDDSMTKAPVQHHDSRSTLLGSRKVRVADHTGVMTRMRDSAPLGRTRLGDPILALHVPIVSPSVFGQ